MAPKRILLRPLHINEITGEIVDSAMKVHSVLGRGLLESAYQECLAHELRSRSLSVRLEVYVPITYEGVVLKKGYRVDQLVENAVIIELKAVRRIIYDDESQLLSQLRLSPYH